MMVLTHGLSGYAASRVAMPVLRRLSPLPPAAMSTAFSVGAMMPDGDIVARLILGTGRYFSTAWYGHRQASHSITGTFLLAGIVALAGYGPWLWRAAHGPAKDAPGTATLRSIAWAWGCLWCGGLLHLVGDLPTPGMALPLLWPFTARYGSWSHIGWFTPYLWWMFLTAVVAAGLLRWAGNRLVAAGAVRIGIYVAGTSWFVYALALYRWLHYLVVSRYESAVQYAAMQRALLPEPLVALSTEWVRSLWRWMVD